jgi:hypothetical protein
LKTKWLPLAVPLLAIAELSAHFCFAHRAPTPEQWAAARPAVSAAYRPGVPVVVAPYWAEPMARWKLGNQLMPVREVARPDITRYREAIELSAMGARSPELEGWTVRSETKVGPLLVRTRVNPNPPNVTFDFTDHVDPQSADVRIERGSTISPCTFTDSAPVESGGLGGPPTYPAARFRCPPEPSHVFVGVTIVEDEDYKPRRCIWSHPPAGAEIVTRFRSVPLGGSIRGHTGMGWLHERDRTGTPFTIRVLVDGKEAGRAGHTDGDGFRPFEIPLGPAAHTTADVEFRVGFGSQPNHVCFEADSR